MSEDMIMKGLMQMSNERLMASIMAIYSRQMTPGKHLCATVLSKEAKILDGVNQSKYPGYM